MSSIKTTSETPEHAPLDKIKHFYFATLQVEKYGDGRKRDAGTA